MFGGLRSYWRRLSPASRNWLALALTLFFGALQSLITRNYLFNAASPHGIVSLELARDRGSAVAILASWGSAGKSAARGSVYIDFFFIFAYVLLLFGLCQWAAGSLARRSPIAAIIGKGLAWAQAGAGVCDALENIGLLRMLMFGVSPGWPRWTSFFALTKFTVIVLAIVYITAAVIYLPAARGFLSVARTIRFSIALSLAGPLLLLIPGQSLEALRVLAEDSSVHPGRVAVFFLASILFALMSWYWARALVYVLHPGAMLEASGVVSRFAGYRGGGDSRSGERWAAKYLPRACAIVALLIIAYSLFEASGPTTDPYKWELRSLAGLMALLSMLLLWLLHVRRKKIKAGIPADMPAKNLKQRIKALDWRTKLALAITALPGLGLFFVVGLLGPEGALTTSGLGPASVALIGLGITIPVGSALVFAHAWTRIPWISLLIGCAIVFSALDLNDDHEVRHELLSSSVFMKSPGASPAPDIITAFNDWLDKRADLDRYVTRDATGKETGGYPVIFVATEGGGIRAAYQTAAVLSALQDANPAFAQHTFLISSVSGGSLGSIVFASLAARYTSNTADHKPVFPLPRRQGKTLKWMEISDEVFRHDLLSPSLASLFSAEAVQRFLPFTVRKADGRTPKFDRAQALELALEAAWTEGTAGDDTEGGDELSRPLYDLCRDFGTRCVPGLFLNTTRVETGDRMVVSTLWPYDPSFSPIIGAANYGGETEESTPASLIDLDPTISLSASSAACLSARFPIISPSGYLSVCLPTSQETPVPTRIKKRYVDGGYFENSGITTLSDVMTALRPGESVNGRHAWYPVIIRIGYGTANPPIKGRTIDLMPGPCPEVPRAGAGLDEVLGPLRAFFAASGAHGRTAYTQLKTRMQQMQEADKQADLIEFQFRDEPGKPPLPLGWLLSQAARREIDRQIGKPIRAVPGDPNGLDLTEAGNGGQLGLVMDVLEGTYYPPKAPGGRNCRR